MAELPSWVASRLISQGHEPSDYDYDEATKTVSKKQALGQQPNIAEPAGDVEAPKPQVTSKAGAFGANFATGVAPTAAGVGTGALAAAGLTAAGIAAPYITIPVALAAGLGGAYGAGKLQQNVLSKTAPRVNEYVEQANIEHPWASLAGNLASAGPFFETDIQALRSVPRLAKNLVRGTKNDPRDLANAANIAINTGVGGGQSLYDELQKPSEERNYLRPFVNAAGAAVLNNPRPWMGRFGFHRNEYAPEAPRIRDIVEGARNAQVEDAASIISKQNVQPDINNAGVVEQSLANRYNMEKLAEVPAGEATKPKDWKNASIDELAMEDPVLAEARIKKAELDKQIAITKAQKQSFNEARKAAKVLSKEREEANLIKQEVEQANVSSLSDFADTAMKQAQERGASQAELDNIARHYGDMISGKSAIQSKEPDVIPVTGSDLLKQKAIAQDVAKAKQTIAQAPVKTPTTETPILGPIKTKPIIEQPLVQGTERPNAPRETKRYQPESDLTEDSLKNQLHQAIKTGALPPRLTQALHPIMQKLGLWRNVDIQANPELAGAGAVSGLREGYNTLKAEVNLNKAGADTHAHELAHGMLEDMAVRGNARDKYLVRKTFEAAENSPEYKQWLTQEATPEQQQLHGQTTEYAKDMGLNAGVDEFLAHSTGREFVNRLVGEATGTGNKSSWPKEMWSTLKARLGRGSLDDYLRILTNKVISDPEFHAAYRGEGINPVGSGVTGEREQPVSNYRQDELTKYELDRVAYPLLWRKPGDELPVKQELPYEKGSPMEEAMGIPAEDYYDTNPTREKIANNNATGRYFYEAMEGMPFEFKSKAEALWKKLTAKGREYDEMMENSGVSPKVYWIDAVTGKAAYDGNFENLSQKDKSAYTKEIDNYLRLRKATNGKIDQIIEDKNALNYERSSILKAARTRALARADQQYRYNEAVRNQPVSKYTQEELNKVPDFYMESPLILKNSKRLGYNANIPVDSKALAGRLTNTLTPLEKDILEKAGFNEHVAKNPRMTANDMSKWISENADPRIESHNYGQEGKVSEAKKEYDRMTHEWYDNLDNKQKIVYENWLSGVDDPNFLENNNWSYVDVKNAEKYRELEYQIGKENSASPRATQYYDTLSAFDKTKHPIQRVDVVLPHRYNKTADELAAENKKYDEALARLPDDESRREIGRIRPQKNIEPLWQQDNLHENLPNTLGWAMIQYKDHPIFGKVAYLEEVQSRWGQEVRNEKKRNGPDYTENAPDHPLLKDYNRLILKAAIQQAKKEGATHIVISDADSAMITEGHDKMASAVVPADRHEVWKEFGGDKSASEFAEVEFGEDWREGKYVRIKSDYYRIDKPDNNPVSKREIAKELKDAGYGEKEGTYIPQEGGMRYNYGPTFVDKQGKVQQSMLPRIAEELTGSKGQPVSLGEHKRAFESLNNPNQYNTMGFGRPREDLIFKNPDGTTKTEATGLAYPVSETPEKFSLTSKRYQPESSLKTEDVSVTNKEGYTATPKRNILFRPWTDVVSRLAEKQNNPTGTEVADKIGKTLTDSDRLAGQFGNKLVAATRDYTPDEISRVRRVRYDIANGETPTYTLTLKERALQNRINNIFKEIGLEHQKRGMMVKSGDDTFRQMQLNPAGYDPAMPSLDVVKALVENKPEAEQYMQDFIAHAKKRSISEEQAREIFNDYRQAIGNVGLTPDIRFGALRKVQGIGLPWSMVEKNFNRLALRYGNRAAHDMAFFKYLQNDPRMMKALGIKDQYGNKFEDLSLEQQKKAEDIKYLGKPEEVQDALHAIYGLDLPTSPRVMSAVRAVASAVMGPGTAARNQIQWAMTVSPYHGVNPKTMAEAVFHANDAAGRAFENNAIRAGYKDFDAAGDFEGNPDKFINYADKFVSVMRKYSGRDLSDHIEGLMSYSLGEVMATRWTAAAKIGDVKAQRMLERFGTTLDKPVKEYFKPETQLTQEDISKIAKEFTDAARGTYSAKGLPDYAIRGEAAPLFALSRWSIERANLFHKDVVKPLTQHGDIAPLLKVVFAGLMSGAAIEKLNEALTDKRAADPTIKETMANADTENVTAKLIGLAQLGSIAGIMSDSAKLGMNVYQGKDIKFSQPLSVPAMSAVEGLMQNTSFASQALHSGEDPVDVLTEYMKDFLSQTFQAARYVRNNVDTENTKRKEKFRDVQVWKELQHEGKATDTGRTNPYEGIAAKKFKRTEDIGEAAEMLPNLLTKAFEKAKGDPYKLKAQLRSLKSNSYQTMPNPENFPMDMARYYLHLSETQGETEAANRLADYLSKNAVNKVKSQMVPSL